MAPKRSTRRRPRAFGARGPLALGVELLENRLALATLASGANENGDDPATLAMPAAGELVWHGQRTVAYRDSYIVQMPTAKVTTPRGYVDYVSAAPGVVGAGWSVQELGMGFYSVVTPGATIDEISAWATAVGVASIEPNQILVKQANPGEPARDTDTPFDTAYDTYLWGLNNSGDPTNGVSPESAAAAKLGNAANIFPRTRDADIDAPEAWFLQKGNPEVIVAVFDDGIDSLHPDLAENMWSRDRANLSLAPGSQIPAFKDNQTKGVDQFGFNSAEFLNTSNYVGGVPSFYEGSPFAPYSDPNFVSTRPGDERLIKVDPNDASQIISWRGANDSHGTHVAGIIGAKGNNNTGITGVNWTVSLYSANIFRYGDYDANGLWHNADQAGSMAAFIHAVNRIRILKTEFQQNFVVANLSFNTYVGSTAMRTALDVLTRPQIDGGCAMLVVVAAGNGYDPCLRDGVGDLIGGPLCQDDMTFPAGYKNDFPNMIVVTASNAQDELPRFANWGPTVDIAAPGENIWSTVPLNARRYHLGKQGVGADTPVQYDSFEPFWRTNGDPPNPAPPSGGDVTFVDPGPISRPYMYREVPRAIQVYDPGDPAASEGSYASMSGTSMATAYVSGVAALMAAEFFNWTEAVPSANYLKEGILTQADVVPTLHYAEGTDDPPNDYQHAPTPNGVQVPIARTGMYETPTDPATRTHSISGDRRLNAYNCVWWVRNNLPPSITVIDRPETPEDRGESRLEGDTDNSPYTPFWYTVVIDGDNTNALTIRFWTEAITNGVPHPATPGVDYVAIPSTAPVVFTIAPHTKTFNIPVPISVVGDKIPEFNEPFRIRFSVDANPQSVWMSTRRATSIIIDDDPTDAKPLIKISKSSDTVVEGNGGVAKPTQKFVEFTLSKPSGGPAARAVLIPYSIKAGALAGGAAATMGKDFIGASYTTRIAAGQTSVRVPVYVIGDKEDEIDEQFQVILGTPNFGVKKRGSSKETITIQDDDATVIPPPVVYPAVSLVPPISTTVNEGSSVAFGINLVGPAVPAGWAVAVYYTVSGGPSSSAGGSFVGAATIGTDVVGVSSRKVVIPAGAPLPVALSVATRTDRFVETDERFTVRLARAVLYKLDGTAPPKTLSLGVSSFSVTIKDVP